MEDTTLYDIIIHWALNHPAISVIVLACSVLIAIPQIRDGVMFVFRIFCPKNKNNDKEFIIEYADETIKVEEKLISQDFDIIKINATTHFLGVRAEREWLNKIYPGYENCMQMLTNIKTNQGRKTFDILPIRKGNIKKDVYFDLLVFIKVPSFLRIKKLVNMQKKKSRRYINNLFCSIIYTQVQIFDCDFIPV